MNYRLIAFAALILGTLSMASCIDPDQTQEVILEENKEAIKKYIADNPFTGALKNYTEEQEGLYIFWEVVNEAGKSIVRGDTATVDYVGKLLNNEVFDTSIEQVARDNGIFASGRNYQPLKFRPGFNFAIVGFEFAIGLMKEGEKATVIMPSRLGYGTQPNGPVPANAPLIFEIELLKVDKVPQN
ncbi:FKBP-type peptidyl-prolyl cis-trans isomerase [Algoriphagus boritolerans]|uniref:Peptidyl-prolyl cis-trans isomerase n=1 Tax=Algoriphagus boritolerans DSM 17298 = JCM 18970 TaxID=1120964 RepID=A0A1H6ACX1_9BACT|nr:FKBP-type peptidyl-prolyl cis-trans isomerase [Algoriphagus boritolerans]SEG46140.1 FKBP-type peptidyl-prolyl cis-trans isomerase FklB [Algoriphagus boritolerans DSM 17298 = JCM 18970]